MVMKSLRFLDQLLISVNYNRIVLPLTIKDIIKTRRFKSYAVRIYFENYF
jgi:hypothetical protein